LHHFTYEHLKAFTFFDKMANSGRPPHLVCVGSYGEALAVYVQSHEEQQVTKPYLCYAYFIEEGILAVDYNAISPEYTVEELGWCTDVVSFHRICSQVLVPAHGTDEEKFSAWKSELLDVLTNNTGWERCKLY
jgi:hypothetical protein